MELFIRSVPFPQNFCIRPMERQLEALTQSEFMEINRMTVYYMNTDKKYIMHRNKEFEDFCKISGKFSQ